MSGTQVPSASGLGFRLAHLDEGAARIIRFHAGTEPDSPESLLKAIEDHYRCFPDVPIIRIHRKPASNGRQGAMKNVTCGLCSQSGKFQKIADHIVSEHFGLNLWYCGLNSCTSSLSRKSDLVRHQLVMHKVERPRKAKAEKRSQVSSPANNPLSPPTPGPTRNSRSRSRSRDPSYSPSYSVHTTSIEGAYSSRDTISWPSDDALLVDIQGNSGPGHHDTRGRPAASRPLTYDCGGHPILVLPKSTPLTNRISSFPDDSLYPFTSSYAGGSSPGLGIATSDTIDPSERAAARPLPPSTSCRQIRPFDALNCYSPSNFLSPPPRTPATSSPGIGLSPLPAPVYRVTTPVQSNSVHLGMYYATDLTEGMQLVLPPSNPQRASIRESSQGPMVSYPMASPPQYYPPRAQLEVPNAVPAGSFSTGHWGPTLSGPPSRSYTPYPVDDEFTYNFGAPEVLFSRRANRHQEYQHPLP